MSEANQRRAGERRAGASGHHRGPGGAAPCPVVGLDQGGRAAAWSQEVAVPPSLRPWVSALSIVRYPDGFTSSDWLVVPDVSTHLLVTTDRGGESRSRVVGPRSTAVRFPLRGRRWMVGCVLRPGALARLSRLPGSEWTDRVVPLGEVVPPSLREPAADAGRGGAVRSAEMVLSLLQAWTRDCPLPDHRLSPLLRAGRGSARVDEIARQVGLSPRRLREVALEEAGLAPKRLLRVTRILGAATRVAGESAPLGRIAHATGFADQAHMTREFLDLMADTPSGYRGRARGVADSFKPGRAVAR